MRCDAIEVISTSFIVLTLKTGTPLSTERISLRAAAVVFAGSPVVRITSDMLGQLESCAITESSLVIPNPLSIGNRQLEIGNRQ